MNIMKECAKAAATVAKMRAAGSSDAGLALACEAERLAQASGERYSSIKEMIGFHLQVTV